MLPRKTLARSTEHASQSRSRGQHCFSQFLRFAHLRLPAPLATLIHRVWQIRTACSPCHLHRCHCDYDVHLVRSEGKASVRCTYLLCAAEGPSTLLLPKNHGCIGGHLIPSQQWLPCLFPWLRAPMSTLSLTPSHLCRSALAQHRGNPDGRWRFCRGFGRPYHLSGPAAGPARAQHLPGGGAGRR